MNNSARQYGTLASLSSAETLTPLYSTTVGRFALAGSGGRDPLYTWGVEVNVIWGVILGRGDHHCSRDSCYYIRRE